MLHDADTNQEQIGMDKLQMRDSHKPGPNCTVQIETKGMKENEPRYRCRSRFYERGRFTIIREAGGEVDVGGISDQSSGTFLTYSNSVEPFRRSCG